MALSVTVRGSVFLGGSAGLRMTVGEWTGLAGDAAGTLTFAGPIPWLVVFQKFDTLDNTFEIIPRVEASYSNGITTYTIENQDNVTQGRFCIIQSGS